MLVTGHVIHKTYALCVVLLSQRELADARRQRFAHKNARHVARVRQVCTVHVTSFLGSQLLVPFGAPASQIVPSATGCVARAVVRHLQQGQFFLLDALFVVTALSVFCVEWRGKHYLVV